MSDADVPTDRPVLPILLNWLREGDDTERRMAAKLLTAINPRYEAVPRLMADLERAGNEIDNWDYVPEEVCHKAFEYLALVGAEASEAVPILIRDLLESHTSGGLFVAYGPRAVYWLLDTEETISSSGDERARSAFLSEVAEIIERHPGADYSHVIDRMIRILERFEGFVERAAACNVLRALGRAAAPLAVDYLRAFLREACECHGEEAVDAEIAARDALEAIAPDGPDVRAQLDAAPVEEQEQSE